MKLIIGGSTGYVATEIIRQAAAHPAITSIIALARRETSSDSPKVKSVVLADFENYPDAVKQELTGAGGCIWTIAVTPSKLKTVTPEESAKISRDYAVTAIDTISHLARPIDSKTPLRFIYMSGANAERDPAKKPWVLGDNALMRGEAESRILEYAEKSNGAVEAAVAKPGLIVYPGKTGAVMTFVQDMARSLISLPKVDLSEASAALLHQCINGFEKETLLNEDLARIGQSELARQAAS